MHQRRPLRLSMWTGVGLYHRLASVATAATATAAAAPPPRALELRPGARLPPPPRRCRPQRCSPFGAQARLARGAVCGVQNTDLWCPPTWLSVEMALSGAGSA